MNTAESKYIDKKNYLSRYTHAGTLGLREAASAKPPSAAAQEEWRRSLKEELPRFIPFLAEKCGLIFRGRILEIGAGGAWLSAELSKLPGVVEIVTTDISPDLLQQEAPRIFKLLNAKAAKITRMPADFHQLDFPANHFDFVVCSAVLQHAANVVQALREAKRVLKPGGRFVALREPVWPLVKLKSSARMAEKPGAAVIDERCYTAPYYKELFKQAALPVEVKPVNLSRGFKYFIDHFVNGLTHARYAFIGTKRSRVEAPRQARTVIRAKPRQP